MLNATLETIARAANATLLRGKPETSISGTFTDTRAPLKGALFIAIRGENFNGNQFAAKAAALGAAAVLVDDSDVLDSVPHSTAVLWVPNTREAYLALAAQHRAEMKDTTVFGITGSVGKSTTKEMLAHVLSSGANWNVHKAKGSFNNEIGLSHTILHANAKHRAAVLELGTNNPGEIGRLADVARPDIAILTCAAESHLEAFKTVENVAREKAQIFAYQTAQNVSILNADSPFFEYWRGNTRGRIFSFGCSETADLRARQVVLEADGCARFLLRFKNDLVECRLKVAGAHQVPNALGVAAGALAAGLSLRAIAQSLSTFEGIERRFNVSRSQGVTLIDDAYNANPASFRAALDTLQAMNQNGGQRLFVIAGDMLELGESADAQHRELGRRLANCSLDGLVTVGDLAHRAGLSAIESGLPRVCWNHCYSPEEAALSLRPALREGDVVLVKGSHSVNLDRCCRLLSA